MSFEETIIQLFDSLTCFVVTLHTPGAGVLQLFIARWGLGSRGRTEAQGGYPGKEKDLGRTEEEDRQQGMSQSRWCRPSRDQSGDRRREAGGGLQRTPESFPGSKSKGSSTFPSQFQDSTSQGSSFFNVVHMNPLRVFYDADSDLGVPRWDLGFPFLANFWMILMLLVQVSCVMQQSLRPTQKEAKQITRKLAGVGSEDWGQCSS